jgi:hypothetical protein
MAFSLKELCTPAYLYFVISIIALVIMAIQNYGNTNVYCLGDYSCGVSNTTLIFLIKLGYILLWTWILSLICKAGVPSLSWFLVLLPIIIMFVLIAMLFIA